MSESKLTKFLLLPKLKLVNFEHKHVSKILTYYTESISKSSWCPNCGLECFKVHDRREVSILDAPQLDKTKIIKIIKKRYRCCGCKKVHTETIPGVQKSARISERMQKHILFTCNNFANLKAVQRHTKVGSKTLYKRHYKQLELEWRKRKNDPWPKTIGIDEHSFCRNKKYGHKEFATIIVDHNNKRVKELIPGRISGQIQASLRHIPGRENVKNITMDLSVTYKSFAQDFFPNAKIVADKFHVLRLLNTALNKYRKQITGHKKGMRIRKLLLMNSKNMDYFIKREFEKWLLDYPELREIYYAKEMLFKLYRCKGRKWAKKVFVKLTDTLAHSKLKELKSLRKTLISWQKEILNYFESRITNARTEGYNNVCKQLQKRAYGYKSFSNYRLRVLYVCQQGLSAVRSTIKGEESNRRIEFS